MGQKGFSDGKRDETLRVYSLWVYIYRLFKVDLLLPGEYMFLDGELYMRNNNWR